uniref:Uncharacterized protein n=1 Tax=Ditylenchus dipsaci TaxID=166011 RepID=A0A915DDE0_9BILA
MMSAPKSPLLSPVSSSVSVKVVGQPWNPLLVISQPQVEAAFEESKQLSIQWKKSVEGSIQNTIASPCLYCNCESPSGSRLNKSAPKSPLLSPVSSSVSVKVVGQPWNPLLVISQPQVEAAFEESKQLSIQWKKSVEGSIQNTIASPCLYCNCESPSGSRLNKSTTEFKMQEDPTGLLPSLSAFQSSALIVLRCYHH